MIPCKFPLEVSGQYVYGELMTPYPAQFFSVIIRYTESSAFVVDKAVKCDPPERTKVEI